LSNRLSFSNRQFLESQLFYSKAYNGFLKSCNSNKHPLNNLRAMLPREFTSKETYSLL
jgi:hypothetical protein